MAPGLYHKAPMILPPPQASTLPASLGRRPQDHALWPERYLFLQHPQMLHVVVLII